MAYLTERQLALRRAQLYVMPDDTNRPRHRWVLRRGQDTLIHWALEHEDDSATALPWCFQASCARLAIFWRRSERFTAPTCVYCALPRIKHVRLRMSDLRRFKR
jgi:hypothetical protein